MIFLRLLSLGNAWTACLISKKNFVFLNVVGTIVMRIGRNFFLYNYDQLRLAVHIIVEYLKARFSPSDIVFMAPYFAATRNDASCPIGSIKNTGPVSVRTSGTYLASLMIDSMQGYGS